jgi:hypothetical protein
MSNIRVASLYLLYVVLIAGITVGIVFSLKSDTNPKTPAKPSTTQTQVAGNSSDNSANNQSGSKPQNSGGEAGNAASQAGSSVSEGVATATTGQLANTGPGDVLALFVVSAVLGAIVHRRFLAAVR